MFGKESVWRTRRLARANQSRTVREHDGAKSAAHRALSRVVERRDGSFLDSGCGSPHQLGIKE